MANKCPYCGGRKTITANFGDTVGGPCHTCDGTGLDLSTCGGVPPGSGGELLWLTRERNFHEFHAKPHHFVRDMPPKWGGCNDTDCVPCGVSLPASWRGSFSRREG